MDLTADQQQVVDHRFRAARVTGAAGTGKTTSLVARYLRLVADHPASSVLVVCRNRPAADRFRDAVLPALSGGFDALPITTVYGVAHDLVTRHRGPVRLMGQAEQWHTVERLLSEESPANWPVLGRFLGRRAFVDEVVAALAEWQTVPSAWAPLGAAADAATGWPEIARFAERYSATLAAQGKVDGAALVAEACVLAAERARPYTHVLVDDHEALGPAAANLTEAVSSHAATVTVTGNPAAALGPTDGAAFTLFRPEVDITLTDAFRHPAPPVLICCPHPSVEPEVIARQLLASHDDGAPWSHMAVLVRSPRRRAPAIARALARHGIPVAPVARALGDDPAVAAVVDMLRWVDGDEAALDRLLVSPLGGLDRAELRAAREWSQATDAPLEHHARVAPLVELRDRLRRRAHRDTPAELAFDVWQQGFTHLAGDTADDPESALTDVGLDAIVAFLDALQDQAEHDPSMRLGDLLAALDGAEFDPDPWRVDKANQSGDKVTIASISSAGGRQWHTVVIAGCVEGELPRIGGRAPLLDPSSLAGDGPPTAAERRRLSLERERRLFALAGSRATARVVGTAAAEPGVLVSRFVEPWAQTTADLPGAPGPPPTWRGPTQSAVPVFPQGRLRLSATQLDTYDDCPLRYAYQYALGVRGDSGVQADLGTLVHDVLAEFLSPARAGGPSRRTRDDLMAIADRLWRDDIARYRPQVEEARRDFFAMLEQWWETEGHGPLAPEVLDVEREFSIEVGGHRLTGAIDRIDRADDGEGIRIVDYKTGKKEPRPDELPDNLQLAVYHLAASRDPELAALGPPTQLRLLFLRTMNVYEQEVRPDHAATTEARVLDAARRILAENFEPSVEANCRNCDFHRLCPLQPEGRQVVPVGPRDP